MRKKTIVVRELVNNKSMALEMKRGKLAAKTKALNLTMWKSDEAILPNNKEHLSRRVVSFAKKVEVMHTLIEVNVELEFVGGE